MLPAYGFPWCAMRTTNCYGRWDNAFFVTESIISQMVTGGEVNLGYAEPYRNFIHIDDLINLYTRIINNPHAAKALVVLLLVLIILLRCEITQKKLHS